MKAIIFVLTFTLIALSTSTTTQRRKPDWAGPLINRPKPPSQTFRHKRDASPQGSVVITQTQPLGGPDRRPSTTIDYQHKIFENRNGQITAGGGATKFPGQRWDPHIGIQGSFRFKREAQPQQAPQFGDMTPPQHGSISLTHIQPLSGPERRPAYNLDYQHKIFEHKQGYITAGGGAVKLPGEHWQPQIGVQGHFRFRREASPQDRGSASISMSKPMSGPERRPTYNMDFQHKIFENKHGHISAGGGAVKYPGQNWQPQVGVQGQFRFKREASPQGSVVLTQTQPLSGPDRRPSTTVEYQQKLYESKFGEVTAGGGATKVPGQRWDPHVGIQGTFRFKREASPQDRGSASISMTKPMSGPERRPTYNVDYQHKIFENKNGYISAGGGAVKFPGEKWQPQVGLQARYRFRRETEDEDAEE